jgi:SH3/ankyrin repeat-containing protein
VVVEPTFVCRWGEPHTVILHRGQKGFGFVLRGAKADSPLMELQPSERFPALQYLDDVDENGVADRAGLRKGDFILAVSSIIKDALLRKIQNSYCSFTNLIIIDDVVLQINGADVSQLSHEIVVDMIRKSGELVSMTVVGLSRPAAAQQEDSKPGSPASLTCDQGGTPKAQVQNHFATLPRKHSGSSGPSVPSPPRRDPTTSLSVGRARAKSMVAALADLGT